MVEDLRAGNDREEETEQGERDHHAVEEYALLDVREREQYAEIDQHER